VRLCTTGRETATRCFWPEVELEAADDAVVSLRRDVRRDQAKLTELERHNADLQVLRE